MSWFPASDPPPAVPTAPRALWWRCGGCGDKTWVHYDKCSRCGAWRLLAVNNVVDDSWSFGGVAEEPEVAAAEVQARVEAYYAAMRYFPVI